MLKTNSRKAKENIRKYILDNFTPCNYEQYSNLEGTTDYKSACNAIYSIFKIEKPSIGGYANMTDQERFIDWCSGLPGILDTCYYYNRSAIDDLGNILEETPEEKERYTDDQACYLLTKLIYREIVNNI